MEPNACKMTAFEGNCKKYGIVTCIDAKCVRAITAGRCIVIAIHRHKFNCVHTFDDIFLNEHTLFCFAEFGVLPEIAKAVDEMEWT